MKKEKFFLEEMNDIITNVAWGELRQQVMKKAYKFFNANRRITVEDATHDALEKIFNKIYLYTGNASFNTWALSVANNHFIDMHRKDQKYILTSFIDGQCQLEDELYDTFPDEIEGMLHHLPQLDESLLRLKYFEKKSSREIAALLALKEQYVPVYMKRARAKLAELVKDNKDNTDTGMVYEAMASYGIAA